MLRRAVRLTLAVALASTAACATSATPTQVVPIAPAATPAAPRAAAPPTRPAPPPVGFRLPTAVQPLAYRFTLALDPSKDVIQGDGEIDLELGVHDQPVDVVYLNAHELDVDSATLGSLPLTVTPAGKDVLAFQPTDPGAPMPAGHATLHIRYRARVHHEDTQGAFAQKIDDAWYAFSQFEPIGARRLYPSFDEPQIKVPWQLTLLVPRGLTAISNMPVKTQADEGELTRVTFEPTPPLPSYMITIAVGPFELVDAGKTPHGAPIRVAVPRGHAAEAAIPVEETAPILATLEAYFGTPYPWAKLDMVPIPDTVGFGAMENAGMITYSARVLLSKPEERTIWDKRKFAIYAAHEMAHQWFGDLVTMSWWDDLWLNEGFASWMENRIVDTWKPEWKFALSAVEDKLGVMGGDARDSARKIRQPVTDENDVNDAFDGITYQKGAAVIGMIERWLGAEVFQKGIQAYLAEHAYKNASYGDLVAALEKSSGKNVHEVMDDFVDRTGVPYVSFTLVCEPGAKPRVEMAQQRFVPLGSKMDPARTWHIPVRVRWQAGKARGVATAVLADAKGSLELTDAPACPEWIMPNEGGTGYYRWKVAGAPYERLRAVKAFRSLPAAERIEVASSVTALITAGELPYRAGLELTSTLVGDPEPRVRQLGMGIGAGWTDLLPDAVLPRYRAWVKKVYGPIAQKLGWTPRPGESADERSIRRQALARLIFDAADPAYQKEALRLAWKWLDDRKSLDPEMSDFVLGLAAHGGDVKLFERLLDEARKANKTNDKEERERFLDALGGFREPALVARARDLALDDEFPALETEGLIGAGSETRAGRELVWQFLVDHYDAISARRPREHRAGLLYVASDCTQESFERTKAFFAERTPKELSGPRRWQQFLEGQPICIARRARDTESLVEFLSGR
jgi:alanyl aminopeptidase